MCRPYVLSIDNVGETKLFETHPDSRSVNLLSVSDDHLVWKIVMQNEPREWFYITQIFNDPATGETIHTRMILISQVREFAAFVHAPWRNSSIGAVYLISPAWEPLTGTHEWDMDLLNAILEFESETIVGKRHIYKTRAGSRFSAAPNGVWDKGEGKLIYASSKYAGSSNGDCATTGPLMTVDPMEIMTLAYKLYGGDLKGAILWMQTAIPALGNKAPFDMISIEEHRRVVDVINELMAKPASGDL